jgi:predicted GNAT superfamily acetyltransferase
MPPPSLRLLDSEADYAACVRLQRLTWGAGFGEVVPASVLKITSRVGGIVAGAFEGAELLGFVYGITGLHRGRLAHWSHMLAVRADARDHGIGLRLKHFQRDVLRGRGVRQILWSFDPLVARNAHLNLVRLRVRVDEYVPDMYPASNSELHGFGTDRLVVAWDTGDAAPSDTGSADPVAGAPFVSGDEPAELAPPAVRIEIPPDIEAVAARSPEEARGWRAANRRAFTGWLGRGYAVAGFRRDDRGRCGYLLTRPGAR